jgi:internalin A
MTRHKELLQLIRQAARDRTKKLDLSRKGVTVLPPEIGQLTNLTYLDLYNNQLTELPAEIGQLTNLTQLDLSFNQLTELPAEIGQLTNLTQLKLSCNRLTELPPEIGQLTNLTQLDLSYSRLKFLSPEIVQLIKLTALDLRGNQLPIPPEILEKTKEPATIINYYMQLQVGQKKPLNEAKMLVVGQGSVGKTSLVKLLVENRYNPLEPKTEGINIQPWRIPVNGQDIRLNVWDFGGQEIMHATHQFFLTKRSLYVLVVDARLGEEENRIEYWLKLIQSFGGNSPVIVVGNKVDQQPLDLDRRGLQTKYKNIRAFVETSCETSLGLDALKAAISQQVGVLEHLQDQLLLTWFAVKEKLENMERDFIPYTEYEQMCQFKGIINERCQRTLIGFLHDLGIVLNFQDDPRMEDTNILNPHWVTNGVYKILNDNELMTQQGGILEREMLNRILDLQKYPRQKHLFIVDMMRKFEICFDLEGFTDKKFLIPDLLTKEEPYTGDWQDTLLFQYHYNVLPSSIISRFIVRMNHKIHKKTYWRSGVVLADKQNIALVKADREDKKIFIWVSGSQPTRRNFLSSIRCQFDYIHKTIAGIEAKEKVPLPDRPEIVVDYEHLLNLEELDETSFIPSGLKTRVNVKQLLDGIETECDRIQRWGDRTGEDITEIAKLLASRSININNMQENNSPMSTINQFGKGENLNQFGKGDNFGGDKVGRDKIGTQINNSQNLAQAATDIKELLDQLSKDYPSNTPAGQAMIGAKAIEEIEKNPTLKKRVVNALKEAGATALEKAIDHPAVGIVVAGAKGFMDA